MNPKLERIMREYNLEATCQLDEGGLFWSMRFVHITKPIETFWVNDAIQDVCLDKAIAELEELEKG